MTQHSPPPGWYEHPGGGIRWWDGAAWTAHTHDGPVPPAAPSSPMAPLRPEAPMSAVLTAPAQTRPADPVAPAPDEQLWDYGAGASDDTQAKPAGTGIYRELSPRTTGIVMLACAVPVLGWLIAGPFITGMGYRFGLGFGLWLVGGIALVVGGLNRLGAARRTAPTTAAAPTSFDFGGVPSAASVPAAPAYPAASAPTSAWTAPPQAAPIPATAAAVPYSGYGRQRRSGYAGVGSRGWVLAVLAVIAVLLVGYGVYASQSSEEPAAAPAAAAPVKAKPKPAQAAKPWAPKGWKQVAGGVAWKKSATIAKDCERGTACVKVAVMTKAACPMVRVEMAFRDAAKAELSTSVAYVKKLQPKKYKVVRVSSPNAEEARYATMTSIKCMDAA